MARLYIPSGSQDYGPIPGGQVSETFGSNLAETVTLAANANVVFDASFVRGNDTILIQGNAADYSVSATLAGILITSESGANIRIPSFGEAGGLTIQFTDVSVDLVTDDGENFVVVGPDESQNITDTPARLTVGDGNGNGGNDGETFQLTTGGDNLVGTDGDDIFEAFVSPNVNGEQTNQLQSGDRINGGAGYDELHAEVQDSSALNGLPIGEIRLRTADVEHIRITAEQAFSASDDDDVQIDAELAYGVEQLTSYYSDASLTFYNVNTLGAGGLTDPNFGEDNGRATASITIAMDHTAGSNVLFGASDLSVYFDADYLIPGSPETGDTRIVVELVDIDNYITDNLPLETNPWDTLVIFIDGVRHDVEFEGMNNLSGIAAYQELAASINAGLAAEGLDTFTATVAGAFEVSDTDNDPIPNGKAVGYQIIITDTSGSNITDVGFLASGFVPGDTDYHKQVFAQQDDDTLQLITSNIVLDKAGQGGDGGWLTVGSMNTGGVEQFNVSLEGADNQDSSIGRLQSTNNVLREVYISAPSGGAADLTIGNSQTGGGNPNGVGFDTSDLTDPRNNALRDVQIFDATGVNAANDVTVHAHLSDSFTGKYLDLLDTDANAAADNIAATYLFGAGNDTLNINLSQANFAFNGATVREDFAFFTDTGAGDDTVLVQIGDGDATTGLFGATNHWYTNHLVNQNLTILTGDGDDFVNTWGSSAADIRTGAGDDLIYTDNSGGNNGQFNNGFATWVFNSQNRNVDDLLTFGSTQISAVANLSLTVQYKDFFVTVELADSWGSINGVTVTDLSINQAIKDAINNNPTLSDFLVAQDGPGRTLLVLSKVDGETAESELSISIGHNGVDRTPAQTSSGVDFFADLTVAQLEALGFAPDGTPIADADDLPPGAQRWDSQFGTDGIGPFNELNGEDSTTVNNNRVEGGTGNDNISLSTDATSIEHVVISGAFGIDHILHFTSAIADEAIPEEAEVQTLTFTGAAANDDLEVIVTVNGVEYTIDLDAVADADPFVVGAQEPTTAANIAAAVAAAINADTATTGATAVVTDGVVTITYTSGADVEQATAVIQSTAPTETQTVTIAGTNQVGNATITVTIAGEDYSVAILNNDTPEVIAGKIVDAIELTNPDSFELVYTAGDPDFDVVYFTNFDPPAVAISGINTGAPYAATDAVAVLPGDPGVTVAAATVNDGVAEVETAFGYDIFDLSAIIGAGGPEYFHNDLQADNNEFSAVNDLIDSGLNGVLLIDTVDSDDYAFSTGTPSGSSVEAETARLQQLVRAADNTGQTGTDTSVIITVENSTTDADGTYGRFYQVVDGAAAGDAQVTYLGTAYLGGSDLAGRYEEYGNFDTLTQANFTPLSPEQLMATYFGGVIA